VNRTTKSLIPRSRVLEEVIDAQLVRFTALNLYNPQVYNLIHKSLPLIRMMNPMGQITKPLE
jgi:hypothetical protein